MRIILIMPSEIPGERRAAAGEGHSQAPEGTTRTRASARATGGEFP
jgi:hypothetical protein